MVTPEAGITLAPLFSKLPTKRAAYSDRTSALMADMARMAYIRFERPNEPEFDEVLQRICTAPDSESARAILDEFTRAFRGQQPDAKQRLIDRLKSLQFDFVNTYIVGETQAFLAKRDYKESEQLIGKGMLVLSSGEQKATRSRIG